MDGPQTFKTNRSRTIGFVTDMNARTQHKTHVQHDAYEILGIARVAEQKDIHAAFRRLALVWHPDRCIDTGATARDIRFAECRFQAIVAAYENIKTRERRAFYDRYLEGLRLAALSRGRDVRAKGRVAQNAGTAAQPGAGRLAKAAQQQVKGTHAMTGSNDNVVIAARPGAMRHVVDALGTIFWPLRADHDISPL